MGFDSIDYLVGGLLCLVIVVGGYFLYHEVKFNLCTPHYIECELLSIDHTPSTLSTNVAPIISSKSGVSTVVYTTGNAEKTTTVWRCGNFGRLICDRKDVYQFAEEKSLLMIKSNDYDTRIVGIVKSNK